MKAHLCGLAALGIFLGVVGQAKGQASYVFSTFDVPGASSTEAFGINDAGQIVGRQNLSGGPIQGFLLNGGSYTTIKGPAFGIDNGGQIVGGFGDAAGSHGFVLSGGNYITLNVPGADVTEARSINGAGQIVGDYGIGFRLGRGFLYNGTNYLDLPVFGSPVSAAYGINASGQIVGYYEDTTTRAALHGYLNSGGTFTTIDPPDSAGGTGAYGINASGLIVGTSFEGPAGGRSHGYIYSNGIFTTIDVPGAADTAVYGINDLGQIVGSYDVSGDNGVQHGFFASLAPVPEPSTILLLGIGTLGLMGWTWRLRRTA
jgi:uncharacterized membrane protein